MYVYITPRNCRIPLFLSLIILAYQFNSAPHPPHRDETLTTPRRPSSAIFLLWVRSHPTSNRMAPRTLALPPHYAAPRSTDASGTT